MLWDPASGIPPGCRHKGRGAQLPSEKHLGSTVVKLRQEKSDRSEKKSKLKNSVLFSIYQPVNACRIQEGKGGLCLRPGNVRAMRKVDLEKCTKPSTHSQQKLFLLFCLPLSAEAEVM